MTVLGTTGPVLDRAPSLVLTPAVVAHRGASGHRPEHTLDAYRTAVRMGVDDLELDLVITSDGVLVARHESELSRTTDVADHPALAHLRTTRTIDGVERTGWFVEDLTLAQLKTLTARERMPRTRAANTAYDGREGVPTFTEVLAMVGAESARRGRAVGVMVELKHAAHFDAIGLPLDRPLLADLARHGLDHPWARVTLMSFETTILRRLAGRTRLPVVQLLDAAHRRPADLAAAGDPTTYGDLATREGLAWVDEYADGIGPRKDLVLPPDVDGAVGEPSSLVRDAHRAWLTVHVWTLRAENRFLPTHLRRGDAPDALGDMAGEVRALLDAGVDGIITDHPEIALRAAR
jgi:glycerophosphoryl diester phosphodiesterase